MEKSQNIETKSAFTPFYFQANSPISTNYFDKTIKLFVTFSKKKK